MKQTICALYLRVSTVDQGQDTDNQLLQLQEFCDR
ncbi:recombinase family protein [Trichocoleus sp. FACHB-262]|nr:recombinase family protein [Trichocoleus sp. FACHB-262]